MRRPSDMQPFDIQTYRIRSRVLLRHLVLAAIGIIGSVTAAMFIVLRWQFALRNYGPASVWRWITPFIVLLVLMIFLSAANLIQLVRFRRVEVQISPEGISIQHGKKLEFIRWDEIDQLQTSIVRYGLLGLEWGLKTDLQVRTKDQLLVRFSRAYEDIDGLVESIKAHVYPLLMDRYRQSFNGGEPINFGPLTLTSEGMLNGRKALRWKDVGSIQLKGGVLQIQPHDHVQRPKLRVPARKIPNIDVCLQLIQLLGAS